MRHTRLHLVLVGIFLSFIALFSMGCPKKTPAPLQATKPEVTTGTQPIKPTPRGSQETLTPPAKGAEREIAQIAALRGEDIPLTPTPKNEFLEPTPAEKQVLKNIYFDYDRSDIKAEFRPTLEEVSVWMKGHDRGLLIEGHCDERGTNEYNLALGERRALSVRRYLVGLGVLPERLHTISYGEEKPSDPGHAEAAWAKNRRAEFKISAQE
jgi:peptidoglycan-associated lipoprotein